MFEGVRRGRDVLDSLRQREREYEDRARCRCSGFAVRLCGWRRADRFTIRWIRRVQRYVVLELGSSHVAAEGGRLGASCAGACMDLWIRQRRCVYVAGTVEELECRCC